MKNPSGSEKVLAAYLGAAVLAFIGIGSYYLSTSMRPDEGSEFFSSVGIGCLVFSAAVFVALWVYRRFLA